MRLVRVTAAAHPLLPVEEMRAHCRIDHTDDDAALLAFGAAALDWLQPPTGWLGRSLVQQGLRLSRPHWWPVSLELPAGPVTEVTQVTYYDRDNIARVVDPADYFLDGDALVWTERWTGPSLYSRPGAVQVSYTAGYTSPSLVPAAIRQAALMLVAHWYEQREAVAAVGTGALIPIGVHDLLHPFRAAW